MPDLGRLRTIVHVALGGTIACVRTPEGLVPRLRGRDLLAMARVPASAAVRSVDLGPRTILFPPDWKTLADLVACEHDACDGLVVTLGTDTLAYAAAALSLMLQNLARPVVLTGSMRPMTETGSDGPRNLSDALRVACTRGVAGVLVVFHGAILRGAAASKVRTAAPDAFECPTEPPLGHVAGRRIAWRAKPAAPRGRLRSMTLLEPRVGTCKLTPQVDGAFVAGFERYRGVLVEGYGDGNVPVELMPALSRLAKRRLVVLASQCPYGGVAHRYAGGRALVRSGALSAGDATKEMALVRLMWALGHARGREAARRMFLGATGESRGAR